MSQKGADPKEIVADSLMLNSLKLNGVFVVQLLQLN